MHESSSTKGLAFQMWWQRIVSPGTLGLSENPVSIAFLFSQLFTFPLSPPFLTCSILPFQSHPALVNELLSPGIHQFWNEINFLRGLLKGDFPDQLSVVTIVTIERRAGHGKTLGIQFALWSGKSCFPIFTTSFHNSVATCDRNSRRRGFSWWSFPSQRCPSETRADLRYIWADSRYNTCALPDPATRACAIKSDPRGQGFNMYICWHGL